MKAFNVTRQTVISDNLVVAETFLARLVGLLNRNSLKEGEGLLIPSCQCIHMFFMKFPIDAVFIDKNNIVVGLVKNIRPFGLSPLFWKATSTIELPVGTIQRSATEVGDILQFC